MSGRHTTSERAAWLTPARRRWLYRVLLAAIPLLIMYGIIDESAAPLVIALLAAVLGLGTADAHIPTPEE